MVCAQSFASCWLAHLTSAHSKNATTRRNSFAYSLASGTYLKPFPLDYTTSCLTLLFRSPPHQVWW